MRSRWSVYRTLGIVFTWWCPAAPTGKTWPWWYWLWLSNQPGHQNHRLLPLLYGT